MRAVRAARRAGGSAARCVLSGSAIDGAQALPPVPRVPGPDEPLVIARSPFAPTSESFAQYRTPDWFRDAKLGIWAHWGPQAVPMFGDWYARHMYRQGHKQYADHRQRYGHPSKSGWKGVIPLWTAEKWIRRGSWPSKKSQARATSSAWASTTACRRDRVPLAASLGIAQNGSQSAGSGLMGPIDVIHPSASTEDI